MRERRQRAGGREPEGDRVKLPDWREMLLYLVNAITSAAQNRRARVTVRLQLWGPCGQRRQADPDIVVASAKAYLSALNKLQLRSKTERVGRAGPLTLASANSVTFPDGPRD